MPPEGRPAAAAFCSGCGTKIGESARFCPSCGIEQAQFVDPSRAATAESPSLAAPTAGPGRGSVLTSPWRTAAGHRRSAAWIYYALIAVGALILGFHHPVFLLVAILAGLYSTYLFRGGRFVVWFW